MPIGLFSDTFLFSSIFDFNKYVFSSKMPKIKRDHPISKGSVNLSTLPYNSKRTQRRCKVVCSRIMSFSLQNKMNLLN